jgi:hypothetical protein
MSIEIVAHLMDSSEHLQGSDVCLNAVEKIVSESAGFLFIEFPALP